jgi:hypothetical protein
MAGLDPAIHAQTELGYSPPRDWMRGSSPRMTMLLLPDHMQYDLAPVRRAAMFKEIDSLPGAE